MFGSKPATPKGGGYGVGTPAATRPAPVKTETATSGDGLGGYMKWAGLALEAGGQMQEGETANAVAMQQRDVHRMTAKEIEAGTSFDVQRMAEEANRGISSMEVGAGASGAVGGNIMAIAKQASEDELAILMRSREGAIGAAKERYEGKLAKFQGEQARKQGYMKAGATLLQGFI